jgi:hypothetical protein
MKAPFSIDEYRANMDGGQKAHSFYIRLNWPGWTQVLEGGLMGGLKQVNPGMDLGSPEAIQQVGRGASELAIPAAANIAGMNNDTKKWAYYVKSTQLPSSTFGEQQTHWMGSTFRAAGKQTFDDWSVTFYLDQRGEFVRKIREWHDLMHDPQTNIVSRPIDYMVDQEAHLLDNTGQTVAVYKFYGAWPRSIGGIGLSYDDNSIATTDITFAFQYFMVYEQEEGTLKKYLKQGARSVVSQGAESAVGIIPNTFPVLRWKAT